nr:hypothetical protein [Gorillibacterium timonense]
MHAVALLHLLKTFASFELEGEVAPLLLCIREEVLYPTAYPPLAETLDFADLKSAFIGQALNGIHGPAIRAGIDSPDAPSLEDSSKFNRVFLSSFR